MFCTNHHHKGPSENGDPALRGKEDQVRVTRHRAGAVAAQLVGEDPEEGQQVRGAEPGVRLEEGGSLIY